MKTFQQFCEDASHSSPEKEADEREKSTKDFTQKMKERSHQITKSALKKFKKQKEKVRQTREQRKKQAEYQKQRTAEIAKNIRTAGKEALQIGKGVVKFVRNRIR